MRSHHSAVVVIPPEEVWEPIQSVRRTHDPNILRWMPHITLLYPFRHRNEFDTAVPLLATAVSTIDSFGLALARFRFFRHGRGNATVWLDPEPREPLDALQAALGSEFPDCDDVQRHAGGFTPHLSVGRLGSRRLAEQMDSLQTGWSLLRFEVTAIHLIHRDGDEPFRVVERIALGRS